MTSELYTLAGEDAGIRSFITTFYDDMFDDVMIGFFFRDADKSRLIDKEVELVARMLGHSVRYTGRPIREAHAKHPIMGGHFERRWVLLKNAMKKHAVPDSIQSAIEEHTRRLRPQVTAQAGSDCDHDAVTHRADLD